MDSAQTIGGRMDALLGRGMSREKAARAIAVELSGEPETYEDWPDEDLLGYAADLGIPGHADMEREDVIAALRR